MHFVRSARGEREGVSSSSKLQESFGVALPHSALLFHGQERAGHWSEWDGIGSDQKKWNLYVGRIILTASTFQGCCGFLGCCIPWRGDGHQTKCQDLDNCAGPGALRFIPT